MSTENRNLSTDERRELDAFTAAFEGRPVDAEFAELAELAQALESSRPKMDAGFAGELDRRVEDSFPADWTSSVKDSRPLVDRLRAKFANRDRSLLLPVTAGLAGVLIVGTFVATGLQDNGSDSRGDFAARVAAESSGSAVDSSGGSSASSASSSNSDDLTAPAPASPGSSRIGQGPGPGKFAAGENQRTVAHKTEIILGTSPDGVQDVSNKITAVVDGHNGIILNSNVNDGPEGVAGASFRLLIPTAEMEDAVGDLSGIADLRSRSQDATDITAPTLTIQDKLADSRARTKSLLNELAEATTEGERAAVEAEIASQRDKTQRLTTRLNNLNRRASLTPVRVDVQTGEDFATKDNGSWGPADALDDIGGFMGTAAGVALIALAIALPIALLALLIALINRIWVKNSRHRALESDH